MVHRWIAMGLTAAVAAGALAAQAPAPAGKDMTRGEVQARVREHFGKLDKNRDGVIARDEIESGRLAMRGGPGGPGERQVIIKRLGEDGGPEHDMMIEHHGGPGGGDPARDPNRAFDRLDANKDGSISREEFAKSREIRIEKRIVRNGPAGAADGGPAKRMEWRQRGGGMGGARMIVMADGDRDGRITLAEAEAMALRHFDQMDANKDGRVTAEERRAARPMMMRMRQTEHAPKAS